ncbi:MAG: glycosyltransferase family 4 protein [Bryobacterales bacterium]|nr:glycosyltransferase family 4 protein [Bryobacterales bacterium]
MRILITVAHRNLVGGVEKYLQAILPGLRARGHQVALFYEYRFDPSKERIDPPDSNIPCCGIEESGAQAAWQFATGWNPEVVYSQGLERAADLEAALLNKYPTVLYAHNYIGTCVSGEKCHSFPTPQPCDRRLSPMCLVLYYPRRCGGLNPATMWKLYQRAEAANARLPEYAAILVASEHMRREFQRHGVKSEKLHLTPLPNPEEGARVDSQAPKRSRSNLLFVGRLTDLKGAGHLLQALPLAERRLARPLTVTLAGDGPERKYLEEFAAKHRLQAKFSGWMNTREKIILMQQADLLVAPSLWPEPFGLVGIEAGAHGLPAVAYDTGGISEWLIEGYSGELAPADPPTVEGLAGAITRALESPSHYEELCRGAREVASRFTLTAHVSNLESILEGVLETEPHSGSPMRAGDQTIGAQV